MSAKPKRIPSLDALCARGPWATTTYDEKARRTASVALTGDDLRALHAAIADGRADFWAAIEARSGTDRKCDRALQLLRKEGLIAFDRTVRKWRTVAP